MPRRCWPRACSPGVHTLDYAYGRKDPDGKSFGDELKRIGWVGDEEVGARKMHAYFEYHIEQGPILEAEHKQIGVVTHGQGLWWLEFTLTGKEAHTGSTPMNMRVNAGLAMARILEMVQAVAMDDQPGAVGGVGQMKFSPNSRNVLPGTVVFTVDIRSPDQAKLDRMRARIEAEAPKICEALGVGCAVEAVGHFDPVTFDPTLVARVRAAAEELGYSHMNIISGAGHDACWTDTVAPIDHDHVPLRRRAQPQRGRGHLQGLGRGRRRRAVPRGGGDGGDCGVISCGAAKAPSPAATRRPLPPGRGGDGAWRCRTAPLPGGEVGPRGRVRGPFGERAQDPVCRAEREVIARQFDRRRAKTLGAAAQSRSA